MTLNKRNKMQFKQEKNGKHNNNDKIFRTKLSAKFFANTYFLTIYKMKCKSKHKIKLKTYGKGSCAEDFNLKVNQRINRNLMMMIKGARTRYVLD